MAPDSVYEEDSANKEAIRHQVWNRLMRTDVCRPPLPLQGRIPNFAGAEYAANRLEQLPIFNDWELVFCNPDSPQRPVRQRLLETGKRVIMASPRLRSGFIVLDPKKIPARLLFRAATIRGAFQLGKRVPEPLEPVDAKILGSVAVDQSGGRIGKGGGFSDLECSILAELGLITDEIPTITTVHDLQILNENLVMSSHDTPIDIIVTPTRLLRTHTTHPRPKRIEWSLISPKRRTEIAWPPSIKVPSVSEETS